MPKMKFNRFTRGIFLAFSVLILGLILDIGKAVTLHSAHPPRQASVLSLPSLQIASLQRVTKVSSRRELPAGAVTQKCPMNTRLPANVATTTITQTYKISRKQPQMAHHWFFALMEVKVSQWMGRRATRQDLSAKTG